MTVARLAAPRVPVLGTIAHEAEQTRRSERLDQAVEQGLRLAVDPVEILEDQEERLLARLPHHQSLYGVEGALAPLWRVQGAPRSIVDGHVEQGQEGGERGLQCAIQGEELARDPLADGARIIPVLNREVALEEVDDGAVAHRLTVGQRGDLEDLPPIEAMRRSELPGIGGLGAGTAQAADGALLDGGEELGLHGVGEQGDLVEEEDAAVGGLKEAGLGAAGIGEGAALETEQLGLEERLGNGRAVHVHEGPGVAGAAAVDEPGHQPFPGSGLALDQDRRKAARARLPREKPADVGLDRLEGGALADQFAQDIHRAA